MERSYRGLARRDGAPQPDDRDLVQAISEALNASPVDEDSLRRGVRTYVAAQRRAWVSPGLVIMALADLVGDVTTVSDSEREALVHLVILWAVEAYFGHLGGDVVREAEALSDSAARAYQ